MELATKLEETQQIKVRTAANEPDLKSKAA
jgi:hypothetical protein